MRSFVVAASLWSCASRAVIDYRLDNTNEQALGELHAGCAAAPPLSCHTGAPRRAHAVDSRGDCCAACRAEPWCARYNHRPETKRCELLEAGPAAKIGAGAEDGCAAGVARAAVAENDSRPNVVFLVVESTDGRTWQPGYQDDAIPLPNLRALQARGVEFRRHYSNAPVCCPSRATFWSGRSAHRLPHKTALDANFTVRGAWNNYEGLPDDYASRLDAVLHEAGYQTFLNGKYDWSTGSHSENVFLDAWTTYARFAYDVNATGGWPLETMCASNGTVAPGGGPGGINSTHSSDWAATAAATAWIAACNKTAPFFVYTGHSIVHPDYVTTKYWRDQIDASKIRVPAWRPLTELHPCDFQATVLKGCAPPDDQAAAFYAEARRREVRAIYYAMIAEFDEMVGAYVDAVNAAGAEKNTIFVVTSDHGDMQMEKQQFYKMTPYDASASVPMVIADGRFPDRRSVSTTPTQLIDIFPTILDLAGVAAPPGLDGLSLRPLLEGRTLGRESVVSQFHGDDIATSWFLAVGVFDNATFKLIRWGNGSHHPPLLFDLDADPNEDSDLSSSRPDVVAAMDAMLLGVVDYPAVANDVAAYDYRSLAAWTDQTPNWRDAMAAPDLRWHPVFAPDNATFEKNVAEVERVLASGPAVLPCRAALAWPPEEGGSDS